MSRDEHCGEYLIWKILFDCACPKVDGDMHCRVNTQATSGSARVIAPAIEKKSKAKEYYISKTVEN